MEGSAKDLARSAWRASQRRKSRHRNRSASTHSTPEELESSETRLKEEEQDADEPGQMAHQSKGADLAALLSESLQLDRNVLYRSRTLLDGDAEGSLPPSALCDAEQALAVDFAALAESLDQLPLYQLLSVEEELLQPQKQAEATLDAAYSAHERDEPAHMRVEDHAVPMHQEQLAAAQQRLQTVGPDAEGPSPQKDDFLNAQLAQTPSHWDKESTSEAAPETELDELLGMCNAEAPSHVDIGIAGNQVKGACGTLSNKMLHRDPKTTAITCKPDNDEQDLEHWLHSL